MNHASTIEEFDRRFCPLMDAKDMAEVYGLSRRKIDRLCSMGDEAPDWFVRPESGAPRRWLKWKVRRKVFGGDEYDVA